ncbi:MAG TPA: phage minor capsid protein [Saprospiraceae bacterium]|nr:phage minor capsid protein [Saprospiraceae bacterium]
MTLDVHKDKPYKDAYTKVWIEGSTSADNHFYFNVIRHNPIDSGKFINADFTDTRSIPILTNPSEWHASVIRFSVPTQAIPLFNLTADSTNYSVTLSYNGSDFTQYVQAIDDQHTSFSEYWQFFDRVNAALTAAFNALKAGTTGSSPTQAPFLIFDPPTQLTSLIFTQDYDPDVVSPTIEMWVNLNLYHKLFVGYRQTNLPGTSVSAAKRAHMTVTDVGNNVGFFQDPLCPPPKCCGTGCTGPVYYQMSGETVNVGLMNETIGIVFTSNNIPSRSEAIPLGINSGSTTNASRKILIDFITPISGDTPSPRESVDYQYNAVIYRWIDLLGSTPLYTLDIQAWYENDAQDLFPIVLVPGATMTMKILFKKGLVTT